MYDYNKILRAYLLIFLIVLSTLNINSLFSKGLYLRGGLDIPSEFKIKTVKKVYDTSITSENEVFISLNFSLGIEYTDELFNGIEIGTGLTYEGEGREQNNFETVGFNTLPLYFITKYNYFQSEDFNLCFSSKLGYSFINMTDKLAIDSDEKSGGFYYGFSLSLEELSITDKNNKSSNSNIFYEFLYSVSNVSLENNDGLTITKEDISYSKYSIIIGKRFDF